MENPAIIIKMHLVYIQDILEQYINNETNYTRASVYVLTIQFTHDISYIKCDTETATNSQCSITTAMPVKN